MGSDSNTQLKRANPLESGREFAVLLGAQALSNLSSLINWTNSTSFSHPELQPWANLTDAATVAPSVSSSPIDQSAPASQDSSKPSKSVEVVDIKSVAQERIDDLTAQTASTEDLEQEPIAKQVEDLTHIATDIATSKPNDDHAVATDEGPSTKLVAPELEASLAKAPAPPINTPQTTKVTPETSQDHPSQDHLKPAVLELVTQGSASSISDDIAAKASGTIETNNEKRSIATEGNSVQPPVQKAPQPAIQPIVQSTVPLVSQPIVKPHPQASPKQSPQPTGSLEWRSAPKSARGLDTNVSTDEYLRQLERLIIDLNMELGMRESESVDSEGDPTSLLVSRMIDLNLQNLALKEQLRLATGQH